MSSRTGNWMIAFGILIVLIGLCLAFAGLGSHGDKSLVGLGSALFGAGALMIAGGIYLKALVLGTPAISNAPTSGSASNRKPRGGCDLCHKEMPVVHCKVHQFHLCGDCLAQHYDFRACVYVPSTRRGETRNNRSLAAKAHS